MVEIADVVRNRAIAEGHAGWIDDLPEIVRVLGHEWSSDPRRPARGALLMERLGPSLFALGLPYEQRLPILCDAATRIWRSAADAALPTGAEKAAWLIEFLTATWSGVMLREDPDEPLAADTMATARWMARRPGLDPVAIWEWGVVERVSTVLVTTKIGLQPVGRQMLSLADRIAVTPGV